MSDLFSELRARVDGGGEDSSGFSKREVLLVLDTAYQAAKERDDWKRLHGELEQRTGALATAKDDMEGRAVRAETRVSALEASLADAQAQILTAKPAEAPQPEQAAGG